MSTPTGAATPKRDDPPAGAEARPRDPSLDALVEMPDRVGRGLTVALVVRGATITGELISEREFFDEQDALVARLVAAQHVELPDAEGGVAAPGAAGGGGRPTPPGGVGRRKADAPNEVGEPTFVHLRRARLLGAGGVSAVAAPPAGLLWRGRVDSVDGYAILDGSGA